MVTLDTTKLPMRALLLENIHPDAVARLTKTGYEVETRKDELIEALPGVSLLGIRSRTHLTERALAAAPDLVAVGAFCIGVNQIDLAAASRHGVAVFNAPFSNTRSVVELVLAEIISLARRLPEKNAKLHQGVWDKSAAGSHEVRGRRLGIVGYGNIGAQLSVLAENLGMSVCFYDIADKLALGNARRCGTMNELLESVETVTLHVDGRPGNSGLFGDAEFAAMQPRSLFLNLSRGFVVDHEALRRNIKSGHIAGAAIDVFPEEPKGSGEEFTSVLRGLPNVILTPHVGGSTEEAQQDIGEFVAGKLIDYVAAGSASLSVNLPAIALPTAPGTHRLVHIHQNVPGVLASINRVLADHQVNVEGQMLGTRDDIGYAITDIGAEYSAEVLAQLQAMDVTIRLRTIRCV
jgi:D-3-phosphoglycerate dehydrogenase